MKAEGLLRVPGGMVHAPDCWTISRASVTYPWQWSEGREMQEVAWALALTGSTVCTICQPLKPKEEQ